MFVTILLAVVLSFAVIRQIWGFVKDLNYIKERKRILNSLYDLFSSVDGGFNYEIEKEIDGDW